MLVVATQAQAEDGPVTPLLNVVDTNIFCNLDSDCRFEDLDYIEGPGKPRSNS